MKKKYYIEKAKQSILNRVRFHAPIVYDSQIDKKVLFENNIKLDLPIFKFDKPMNKMLLKAFELAQQEQDFNLVISSQALGKFNIKNLKTAIIYSQRNSSAHFLEMINKLNINYYSASNYNLEFQDKFVKINDVVLNPKFKNFELSLSNLDGDLSFDYHEFVLNGTNFFVQFKNKSGHCIKTKFEINLPLKKGYYYFKKLDRCVIIENLTTKEKLYFNFICKNAKFSFSNVDGLENSVFCCINIKVSINLSSKEEKSMFFNLGQEKFNCSLNHLQKLMGLANKLCCEIFNLQIKTKNHDFDRYFNCILPQKIWINWLNNTVDEKLEEKYITLKRLFVRGQDKLTFVKFKEVGLKELGIFNGEYYKKIQIISAPEPFLRVGNTKYFNLQNITNYSLRKKDPILLSFGD